MANNALIQMTWPFTNLFKLSISIDNSLRVDKQKFFIGRVFILRAPVAPFSYG